jgi:hypothetical protein
MITKDKFYIGGQWVAPAGSGSIDVHSPTDGALLARIPQGTAADAEAAIASARRAFDAWAATPPARRAELLKKIQEGLKARTDEIARTITLEMGMPYKLSQRIQVGSPTATFGMYARMLGDFAFEEQVGNSKVVREPVGRRGCHHALELPAAPDRRQGRRRARRRLHHRAQALRSGAAECLRAGRDHPRSRRAARRVQPRDRLWARRSAKRW